MNFQRQVSRTLHEEHLANLDLLGRVEQSLARVTAASAASPEMTQLAAALARLLEQDIGRHFDFEERELFPRMDDAGEGDIASLLKEEHEAIRAVALEILPLVRQAAQGGLDIDGWRRLRPAAMEMIERQVAHIQKETMALLPLLEDLLDDETDRELAFDYAAG